MPNFISEDQIERALVQKLQHLHGFDSLDCHTEDPEDLNDGSGRANKRDVILVDRVREAAVRLNPDIPAKAIDDALEKLLDRRQAMSLVAANQEIYNLLRDGIPVEFDDAKGQKQQERVRLIDFNRAGQEPLSGRHPALDQRRARFPPTRCAALRQRHAAGLHRVEELEREAQDRVRRQPHELQAGNPTAFPDKRLLRAFERHRDEGRQHHGGVGAFLQLAARRGREGED